MPVRGGREQRIVDKAVAHDVESIKEEMSM